MGLGLGPELASLVRKLVGVSLDEATWRFPRPEGLHLTLCFLGDLPRSSVEVLAASLSAKSGKAPTLELTRRGAFPDDGAPRVLWLGVRPEDEPVVAELREIALGAVREAGLAPGPEAGRPFRPHVTVARPRRSGALPGAAWEALAFAERSLTWRPRAIRLYESVRAGAGPPRYEALAEARLR